MIYKTLKLAVVVAALAVCGNVNAQDCGGCNSCGGQAVYGGNMGYAEDNCGRRITQGKAASLWAGYCNESCDYQGGCGGGCSGGSACGGGSGCGLNLGSRHSSRGGCGGGCLGSRGGKLRGKFAGFGGGSSGCGCDMGCFGYPSGGCGCGGGGSGGGGFLSGGLLKGGCFSGHRGNRGGCSGGGKLRGMFSGGSRMGGLFRKSQNDCGCAGSYFGESVGYNYGNAGMQSYVSGCATNACGGGVVAPVMNGGCQSGNAVISGPATGDVLMGEHDPSLNAQQVPAEAIQDAANAVEALHSDAGN